jgi:hypothetical protein
LKSRVGGHCGHKLPLPARWCPGLSRSVPLSTTRATWCAPHMCARAHRVGHRGAVLGAGRAPGAAAPAVVPPLRWRAVEPGLPDRRGGWPRGDMGAGARVYGRGGPRCVDTPARAVWSSSAALAAQCVCMRKHVVSPFVRHSARCSVWRWCREMQRCELCAHLYWSERRRTTNEPTHGSARDVPITRGAPRPILPTTYARRSRRQMLARR